MRTGPTPGLSSAGKPSRQEQIATLSDLKLDECPSGPMTFTLIGAEGVLAPHTVKVKEQRNGAAALAELSGFLGLEQDRRVMAGTIRAGDVDRGQMIVCYPSS
jgi:hypothetical protein